MRTPDLSLPVRHRIATGARAVLAVFGGYAFAALCTASLSVALPLPRAEAVLAATQLSFALYCALVIWAFCAASALRAWLVTLAMSAVPAMHLLLQGAGN